MSAEAIANPTISTRESYLVFVAVPHRMRDIAKTIRNHFLRIATNRRNRGEFLSIYIFSANVSIHPRRTLCAVVEECLVGILFLLDGKRKESAPNANKCMADGSGIAPA